MLIYNKLSIRHLNSYKAISLIIFSQFIKLQFIYLIYYSNVLNVITYLDIFYPFILLNYSKMTIYFLINPMGNHIISLSHNLKLIFYHNLLLYSADVRLL